jgi:hypothetical protein
MLERISIRSNSGTERRNVVDRDRATIRGAPAVAFALSRLPPTAWFALPALLLPAVHRARAR